MLRAYLHAFVHALAGIKSFITTERNAKFHLVASLVVIGMGYYCSLAAMEWLWIALAICLVWVSEMLNTAIEGVCDRITTQHDAQIKIIKDVSAGAVLVASMFAVVVATIIFIPKLF